MLSIRGHHMRAYYESLNASEHILMVTFETGGRFSRPHRDTRVEAVEGMTFYGPIMALEHHLALSQPDPN